jgi:small-conductance mechanosensitive channel
MSLARILALCLFVFVAATSVSFSQTDQAPQFDADAVTALATRAEEVLSASQASDAALQELRSQLAKARTEVLDTEAARKERADALQAQVEALGPPPEEGMSESEEAAARRSELDKQLAEARSSQGIAKESYERVNTLIGNIDQELRVRQSKVLLSLGPSPVTPAAIAAAGASLAEYYRELKSEVASAWGEAANQTVRKNNLPAIIALFVLGLGFMFPGARRAGS